MDELRELHLRGATGAIRLASWNGSEHLVVPVVALMEGVIHAINADVPEFVPLETLAATPHAWNNRPAVLKHPVRNGKQISANSPKVLESQGLGSVFDAQIRDKKLYMEAFIDPVKAEKLGAGDMIKRLRAGETVEVSVGAYVTTESKLGEHNGKPYKAIWKQIYPDHLAFLPDGIGACSVKMGCGTRAAEAYLVTAEGFEDITDLGGKGSGDFGHAGRPGYKGGSGSASPLAKQATTDALNTAEKQLATEHAAIAKLEKMGYTDSLDMKFAKSEVERLTKLVDQLKTKQQWQGDSQQAETASKAAQRASALANDSKETSNQVKADLHSDAALAHSLAADAHVRAAKSGDTDYHHEIAKGHQASAEGHVKAAGTYATIQHTYKSGDVVRYSKPGKDEQHLTFHVIENRGDRVLIQPRGWAHGTIAPQEVVSKSEIVKHGGSMKGLVARLTTLLGSFRIAQQPDPSKMLEQIETALDEKGGDDLDDVIEALQGARHSAADREKIQKVHDHAVELGAECSDPDDMKAAGEKPCGCKGDAMDKTMKAAAIKIITETKGSGFGKDDITSLEAYPEKALENLKILTETKAQFEADSLKAAEEKKEAELKAAAEKVPSYEEWSKTAPPEVRTLVEKYRKQDEAKKAELISTLKTAQSAYSEEELKGMPLETLERLAAVAKVDYSGRGIVPRHAENKDEDVFLNPPDPYAPGLKAMREGSTKVQ